MKKIINGKTYNTKTAKCICDVECRYYPGDHAYHETGLYLSPKGAYFLAGSGGPSSMWSRSCGPNSWSGGSGLIVIDKEEAREYAEEAGASEEEMREAGFDIEEG